MRIISSYELKSILHRMDGKRYNFYKKLRDFIIDYGIAKVHFTKIQGDPYAPPSILEMVISSKAHSFPYEFFRSEVPFTDYLARELFRVTRKFSRKCGSGYSGYIGVPKPCPRILKRSCVETRDREIILRIYVGLPARGRRILGDQAKKLLLDYIPKIMNSIIGLNGREEEIREHIDHYLDQEYLREWLYENDYAFFAADNSILPRESSLSEKPLRNAVPFKSPETLRVQVKLPSGKVVSGMAVPVGVVVVTGGGYHGKTTLLEAIQEGIYNHIKGDGREYVVSRKYTVMVRAEDGRIVTNVDISSFIINPPGHTDTSKFSSLDASGSTSMAASINEVIEAGAELLLIDEDTSATNLLFKDRVMEEIIVKEPIRPLCLQVKSLVEKTGIGIVVVASASSSFLGSANKVILMEDYVPKDITSKVKKMTNTVRELEYKLPRNRVFHGIRGLRKVKAKGYKIVAEYNDGTVFELDLAYYPRIVEKGQVKFIAQIVKKLSRPRKPLPIPRLVDYINRLIGEKGFKAFVDLIPPDLTMVDGFDVVWVLNRLYNSHIV